MSDEEVYKKQLADSGVDVEGVTDNIPKTEEKPEEKPEENKPVDDTPQTKVEEKKPEDDDAGADDKDKPLTEPKEVGKRSIYEAYKDKKTELREEREAREQEREARQKAEKERDELQKKLDDVLNAKPGEDQKDAIDELTAFAEEIDADPEVIKKLHALMSKSIKPAGLDEETKKALEDFRKFNEAQQQNNTKAEFDNEFTQTLPALKEYFPNASDVEMTAIKAEIDKIAHSAGWNDKSIDYIAFKHQKQLSALVSPKKRGMENRDNNLDDDQGSDKKEFNMNPDFSNMTPAQVEQWEKDYKEMTASNQGLTENANGKKMII